MTIEQLKKIMRFYIAAFTPPDDKWQDIPTDKPHGELLPSGGVGTATPTRIYKSLVRRTLVANGKPDKSWPPNWPTMTIDHLAPKLL